jgi:ribosomal-protein-alanine N-acetyltransferase
MVTDLKNEIDALKDSKSADDRKKCIPLLQKFLEQNPNDAQAWYDLAGCFDFTGDEKSAEPCYKKTYELGVGQIPVSEQSGFFVGYGSTLRNNFKFAESNQVLRSGLEVFPQYPALDIFLALTLYSEGKYKSASEQLFKALPKIDSKPFDGYENAIKWYVENLQTHPAYPLPAVVETERLILRPLADSDVEAIFEYCSLPEVSKYTAFEMHKTLDDSRNFIKYAKDCYQRGLVEPLAITLKENPGKMIGSVGWFWSSEKNKSIELAYGMSPKYWGQGIMVEACKAIVNQALQKHDIVRIASRCIAENIPSARVMEKLGMQHEGTQRKLMFVKGRFVDMKNYCVLREDWEF